MDEGKYRVKLDLMISVYDATTGRAVDESNVRFLRDGEPITAGSRGRGSYIFLNMGRENCLMQVDVYGYETCRIAVCYEELDEHLPALDVFLIPSESHRARNRVIVFRGKLSGLKKLEALHPGRPVTSIKDFDAKKMTMSVFAPNRRVELTRRYYGLIHDDKESFEDLVITDDMVGDSVKLHEPIREEFSPNAPICPIIFGQVEGDGSFLLAVQNDGENLGYLVKYFTEEGIGYQRIDFHNLEGVRLGKENDNGAGSSNNSECNVQLWDDTGDTERYVESDGDRRG